MCVWPTNHKQAVEKFFLFLPPKCLTATQMSVCQCLPHPLHKEYYLFVYNGCPSAHKTEIINCVLQWLHSQFWTFQVRMCTKNNHNTCSNTLLITAVQLTKTFAVKCPVLPIKICYNICSTFTSMFGRWLHETSYILTIATVYYGKHCVTLTCT